MSAGGGRCSRNSWRQGAAVAWMVWQCQFAMASTDWGHLSQSTCRHHLRVRLPARDQLVEGAAHRASGGGTSLPWFGRLLERAWRGCNVYFILAAYTIIVPSQVLRLHDGDRRWRHGVLLIEQWAAGRFAAVARPSFAAGLPLALRDNGCCSNAAACAAWALKTRHGSDLPLCTRAGG